MKRHTLVPGIALLLLAAPISMRAEIIVSANDGKAALIEGQLVVRTDAVPDSLTVIRLENGVASIVGDVQVPASVLGPPFSVAITPDERLALVSANDAVSVVDLTSKRVTGTVPAGKGAAGLSISPDGHLALIANRGEGSVSVLQIEGSTVRKIDTLQIADAASGLDHVAITPDGKHALVSRDGDSTLSVLAIDGTRVSDTKRDFGVGFKPYGIAMAPDGSIAVVANVSLGRGDEDTLSVVDLRSSPVRVVNTVSVGQTPEGITISPDGKWLAIALLNGSNKAPGSPFFNPQGKLVLFRVNGRELTRVAEHALGGWPQGAAFGADSQTLLVGNMTDRSIEVFRIGPDGSIGANVQRLPLKAGNAALRAPRR